MTLPVASSWPASVIELPWIVPASIASIASASARIASAPAATGSVGTGYGRPCAVLGMSSSYKVVEGERLVPLDGLIDRRPEVLGRDGVPGERRDAGERRVGERDEHRPAPREAGERLGPSLDDRRPGVGRRGRGHVREDDGLADLEL